MFLLEILEIHTIFGYNFQYFVPMIKNFYFTSLLSLNPVHPDLNRRNDGFTGLENHRATPAGMLLETIHQPACLYLLV